LIEDRTRHKNEFPLLGDLLTNLPNKITWAEN